MMVANVQLESMIALSVMDSAADDLDVLVKGDVDFSETGGSRADAWSDQW
ncbi:MAG: hypothetical protein SPF79_09015 [Bacteroidaceae bacterium]|nr:hypothetical protein [Bacteroidaceae bacterium]